MALVPTLAWRLPPNIEKGAEFGASFSTDVIKAVTGTEQRGRLYTKCRGKGDISYGLRKLKESVGVDVTAANNIIRQVQATFMVCEGKWKPFRFRDHSKYIPVDEIFGWEETGTVRQLGLTYDPTKLITGSTGSIRYFHPIYLPNGTVTVKKDGTPLTPVTDFVCDAAGQVTFAVDPSTSVLTWSADSFDRACRWDTDEFPMTMETGRHASIGKLPIEEVIGRSEVWV